MVLARSLINTFFTCRLLIGERVPSPRFPAISAYEVVGVQSVSGDVWLEDRNMAGEMATRGPQSSSNECSLTIS